MLNCCHQVVSSRNKIFGIAQQNFKYASVQQIRAFRMAGDVFVSG